MTRCSYFSLQAVMGVLLALLSAVPPVSAQGRMNDKDIESSMKNLHEDSKRFRSAFKSAVGKSTIRKTSQEKDAKALVERFEKQTEGMLKQFKSKKNADQALPSVQASADQIDKLLNTTPMGDQANNSWAKVKTELRTLSQQFGNAQQSR